MGRPDLGAERERLLELRARRAGAGRLRLARRRRAAGAAPARALDHDADDPRVRARRAARASRTAPRSPTTGSRRSRPRSPTRTTAAGGARGRACPARPPTTHAFVLLAGASAAIAGRPGGRRCSSEAAGVIDARLLGRGRGRLPRVVGRRAGASPSPTAARTRTCTWSRRSSPPATPRASRAGATRALRIAERLIDDARRGARLARRRALRRRLAAAAGLQRATARRPRSGRSAHARPRARVGAAAARAARGAGRPAGLARRAPPALFGRALADGWDDGFVYTTGRRRDAGGRASGCTGSSPRRSAPPPRCTR